MGDESGESMAPMEEVPLKGLGKSEMERLVRCWRKKAWIWFQRRGKAYWKERSVIRREDDVDGRASVTKDVLVSCPSLLTNQWHAAVQYTGVA